MTDSTRIINRKLDDLCQSIAKKHGLKLPEGFWEWNEVTKCSWLVAQMYSHQKYYGKGITLKVHQLDSRPDLLSEEVS